MGEEDGTNDIDLDSTLDDALFDSYYLTPQTAHALGEVERALADDPLARELQISGLHTMLHFLKNVAEQDCERYLGATEVSVSTRAELCGKEMNSFAKSLLTLSQSQLAPMAYLFIERILPHAEATGRSPSTCNGFLLSEIIPRLAHSLAYAVPRKSCTSSSIEEFYHALDMQFPFLPDIHHLDDQFSNDGDEYRLNGLLNLPLRLPLILSHLESGSLVAEYHREEQKNKGKNMGRSYTKSKYLKIQE